VEATINPKKPVSEKQFAANRANASHSPVPELSKARPPAQNSRARLHRANFAVARLKTQESLTPRTTSPLSTNPSIPGTVLA
jgi:hypothetical protein